MYVALVELQKFLWIFIQVFFTLKIFEGLIYHTLTTGRGQWSIFYGCRLKSICESFVVFVVLVVPLFVLFHVPVLNWSILNVLVPRGDSARIGTNLYLLPLNLPWIGWIFMALLVFNIPLLAYIEEDIFRRGTETTWDVIRRSLKFGFVHCLIGLPLCAGLMLSLMGFWYTYHYFKGGTVRAAMYHALHNLWVMFTLLMLKLLVT